jgi:futalosine hydrolase
MSLLVVAATGAEIAPLCVDVRARGHFTPLITGPGIPATVYALMHRLRAGKPACILNAGLAGSFSNEYPPGAVVRVAGDRFADLGAEDGDAFIPIHDLDFHRQQPAYEKVMAPAVPRPAGPAVQRLPAVQGVTVNTVHGNDASIARVQRLFGPDVETMEGAAVFYVAMKENIPVVQVRAVSNFVQRRNRAAWEIEKAVGALNEVLVEIVRELNVQGSKFKVQG